MFIESSVKTKIALPIDLDKAIFLFVLKNYIKSKPMSFL